MSLSNTAVPKYYGKFRQQVLSGQIAINREISMEMNRIDDLIRNPNMYYDDRATDGWISFCENELTLTDGSDLKLLDSFKLWGEEIFGWYFFERRSVPIQQPDGSVHYEIRNVKRRLTNKQFLIVGRGASKSMYASTLQAYFLNVDTSTTHQITTAPTMRLSDEVIAPIKTAIIRSKGPLFKFLTDGVKGANSTSMADAKKLLSTKKGIENRLTGSLLEVRPLSIDKLQGLRCKVASIDEWLSGDLREDPIGAIEQGASKVDDYLIIATSSEGTVRNGSGDDIKMELMKILKGEYKAPHVSIWYYKLDDVSEVADPNLWIKANPNLGKTVSYESYQRDVEKAEQNPTSRNDILAKRFGIPSEGYTYFFRYEETLPHPRQVFWGMNCSMGIDLSQGDDFCSFTFLFPLSDGRFGIKTRNYITQYTMSKLPVSLHMKYLRFIDEGSLVVMDDNVLNLMNVYDDLDAFIQDNQYNVMSVGYDPYYAKEFIERWSSENGNFNIVKVIQGARTESVPLGELKILAEQRSLLFDEDLMTYTMGNCIVLKDTNNNKKLYKAKRESKIDAVAALMDAYIAYKQCIESY